MGLGSKIKNALHADDHPNQTYESGRTPGAFPNETSANTKHNTTTGTTGTTGAHTGTTGTHTGAHTGSHTGGTHATGNKTTGLNDPSGTHGPHVNRVANAADPRVDSDRDHRGVPNSGLTGSTGTGRTGGLSSNPTHTGTTGGLTGNSHTGTTGGLTGNSHSGTTGGLTGNTHTGTTGGLTSNHTTGYDDPSGTHGPHGNRAANAADPRVDSDRDHRGVPGFGLTGSNNPYGNTTSTGRTGGLSDNPHGGATGGLTGNTHSGTTTGGLSGNRTTGYDDPSGVHGPHGNRAANVADPRVDSDRDHRGAVGGVGPTGTHRPTDSGVDVGHGHGHNKPYVGENLRNAQDPYWGDVPREGHGVTGGTGTLNKDLPLRPNEQRVGHDSGIGGIGGNRGGLNEAVGGGTYNAASTHHHDPASSVDRSIEGREFTHVGDRGNNVGNTGIGSNTGIGAAGNDPYSGVHSAAHNPNAALAGGSVNDPYDTRMRDRDMGRERTGHGAAGAGIGSGIGAGAAVAAGQAAHKHHREDLHHAGYGDNSNTSGGINSTAGQNIPGAHNSSNIPGPHTGVNTRSSVGGNEPGVPQTSMLDPYTNQSPTNVGSHGIGANKGVLGGHGGSTNQGMHTSNVPGNTGLGSSNLGPDHFGPAHEGAKVFHTCTRCGEDNDISRYFKKDAAYRLG